MKYTTLEEKDQIRMEFRKLLKEKKTSLKQFCNDNGYVYGNVVQWMKVGNKAYHIDDAELRKMIGILDSRKRLTNKNGKIEIV